MPNVGRLDDLRTLAALTRDLNAALTRIAAFLGRPALVGHVGEFIASVVFDIDLNPSASAKGHDGYFNANSPLAGRSVNVKWATAHDGLIDLSPDIDTDYYLVLAGPRVGAVSSIGKSRLWVIEAVYLLDAAEIVGSLRAAGRGIGVASSVRKQVWESAMLYPESRNPLLVLTEEQRKLLALFAPPLPVTEA
jgi:Family of unknown function (DUF6998)